MLPGPGQSWISWHLLQEQVLDLLPSLLCEVLLVLFGANRKLFDATNIDIHSYTLCMIL